MNRMQEDVVTGRRFDLIAGEGNDKQLRATLEATEGGARLAFFGVQHGRRTPGSPVHEGPLVAEFEADGREFKARAVNRNGQTRLEVATADEGETAAIRLHGKDEATIEVAAGRKGEDFVSLIDPEQRFSARLSMTPAGPAVKMIANAARSGSTAALTVGLTLNGPVITGIGANNRKLFSIEMRGGKTRYYRYEYDDEGKCFTYDLDGKPTEVEEKG